MVRDLHGMQPNTLLNQARRRMPSPSGSGRCLSRQELAEAVNAYLWHEHKYRSRLDANYVGKLERGEHRWPSDRHRESFRVILGAATDADLGFYIIRSSVNSQEPQRPGLGGRTDALSETAHGPVPPIVATAPAEPAAQATDSSALRERQSVETRKLLHAALANAGLGISATALSLDDLRHIAAALEDAHRYLDGSIVEHFRRRLAECASNDGKNGPKPTLPAVLGIVAAIEHTARKVKPDVRRGLLAVGGHSAEFTGWLYRDLGMPDQANYWRDRATEWALEAGDHAMPGYILLKKSQSAWDERDGLRMLTLSQAVQAGPWSLSPRIRAEAAQQEARGHAMTTGDLDMVERKLDQARELLAEDPPTGQRDNAELAAHYDRSLLAIQTAICYQQAGRPNHALDIYREALSPAVFSRRDYGYFLALNAETLAAVSDPDGAAIVGTQALGLARGTNSVRTIQELLRLREQLSSWDGRPAVREFYDALAM